MSTLQEYVRLSVVDQEGWYIEARIEVAQL